MGVTEVGDTTVIAAEIVTIAVEEVIHIVVGVETDTVDVAEVWTLRTQPGSVAMVLMPTRATEITPRVSSSVTCHSIVAGWI